MESQVLENSIQLVKGEQMFTEAQIKLDLVKICFQITLSGTLHHFIINALHSLLLCQHSACWLLFPIRQNKYYSVHMCILSIWKRNRTNAMFIFSTICVTLCYIYLCDKKMCPIRLGINITIFSSFVSPPIATL